MAVQRLMRRGIRLGLGVSLALSLVGCAKTPAPAAATAPEPVAVTAAGAEGGGAVAPAEPAGVTPANAAQPASAPEAAAVVAETTPARVRPGSLAPRAPAAPAASTPPASKEVDFSDSPIDWLGWDEGIAKAKAESLPVMLFVYADWCPKCRAWGPALKGEDFVELSKKLVMIKLDQDDRAPQLQRLAAHGGYVPRVFFFDSAGELDATNTSGHPRYPYFYASQSPEKLKAAMRKAIGS